MQTQTMRDAFSMITAIFVIAIMASVAAFVMNISGKTVQATTAQYQHEQAELYAKSYTEYAILAVTGNNRTGNCLRTINGNIGNAAQGSDYVITVNISYIGTAAALGTCPALNAAAIATNRTPLSILVDVYVSYPDIDNPTGQRHSVHRRSIQKI